eukprot:7391695-Prymnesium_polylepis.2
MPSTNDTRPLAMERLAPLDRIHKGAVPSAASHVSLKLTLQCVIVPAYCRHLHDQVARSRSGSIQPSYSVHAAGKDAARPADGEGREGCPAPHAARSSGRAYR